jgi:hypothetical protein
MLQAVQKVRAIPVFLDTHAYFDYTGETHDIPTFTCLVRSCKLPVRRRPIFSVVKNSRIPPSSIVFLPQRKKTTMETLSQQTESMHLH